MAWQLLRGFHAVSLFGTMGLEGLQTEPSGSARKALVGSKAARAFFVPWRMFFDNVDCVCVGAVLRVGRSSRNSLRRVLARLSGHALCWHGCNCGAAALNAGGCRFKPCRASQVSSFQLRLEGQAPSASAEGGNGGLAPDNRRQRRERGAPHGVSPDFRVRFVQAGPALSSSPGNRRG